ncbi:MAG: tetratricopeptide repeat protein [Planctomycetaceae bacterium]|jgi:hypothetical protein|nr:tetratricopeptide repeat protein [Planctomycetaceae bacterium]
MSRLHHSTIAVLACLFVCAAVQAEVNPSTRAANKTLYGNRSGQLRYTPYYYYGSPTAPRFSQPQFFVPPPELGRVAVQSSVPAKPGLKLAPIPPAPLVESAVALQPPAPVTAQAPVPPVFSVEKSIERTIVIRDEEPKYNTDDELDALNARLAKIQLEQHNLADALNLVKKIKSPEYTAKTIVDLAEYICRDPNYRSEYDTLYGIALAAIDSVQQGKPVIIHTESIKKTVPAAAEKALQVPVQVPVTPPAPVTPAPAPPVVQPKPVLDVPKPEADKEKPVTPPVSVPKPVPPIILPQQDVPKPPDKPDVKPAAPDIKPDAPKPPDTPTPPRPVPALRWDGTADADPPPDTPQPPPPNEVSPPSQNNSAAPPQPNNQEIKITPPPLTKPKPTILLEDDEPPAPPKAEEKKPQPPPEPVKPERKPLPKKKILLEEN